jgi:hypothetical protein
MGDERAKAFRTDNLTRAGLVTLLARAGGTATFTEAEYQAVAAQYGGTASLAVHIDVLQEGEGEREIQLTLIRKEPANAELVS